MAVSPSEVIVKGSERGMAPADLRQPVADEASRRIDDLWLGEDRGNDSAVNVG
jgi:hypothetical protein